MSSRAVTTMTKGASRDIAAPKRSSAHRGQLTLQRAAISPAVEPGAELKVREALRSTGQPLDAQTKATMEPRFGFDFSGVRVHADSQAAESAKAVRAHAYASGSDVVFGAGKYAPSTAAGQATLSHELTHVVQQASGPVDGTAVSDGMSVSHPSDRFERAASAGASAWSDRDESGGGQRSPQARGAAAAAPLQIQRNVGDDLSTGGTVASGVGGITSGIAALLALDPAKRSAAAAERSASATERQAGAAEGANKIAERSADIAARAADIAADPPVSAPVTGGFVPTHLAKLDPAPPAVKGSAEEQKPVSILRVGTTGGDIATVDVVVSSVGGKRIVQANTQNGDVDGYLGGSGGSNASVTFNASLVPQPKGTDVVHVKFDGTNVGPHVTKRIQRFRGVAKVNAAGALVENPTMSGGNVVAGTPPTALLNIDVTPPKPAAATPSAKGAASPGTPPPKK